MNPPIMLLCSICQQQPVHRWTAYGWAICQECLPGYTPTLDYHYSAGLITLEQLATEIMANTSLLNRLLQTPDVDSALKT